MEANEVAHLRAKYKDRMLQLAFIVAGWSPEAEGQRHGCVLALRGKYIVATGFNGPDRLWKNAKDCGGSCCTPPVIHAEVNATLNLCETLGTFKHDLVAYLTKKPCRPCFEALTKAGVVAMFWLQDCSGKNCFWTAAQGDKLDGYGEYGEEKRHDACRKGEGHSAGAPGL